MKTRFELAKLFEKNNQLGIGAEIGVQHGYFSRQIGKDWKGKILCIDVWNDEEIFEMAQDFLRGKQFKIIRGSSEAVAETIKDGSLDWVYIDADHHYAEVKNDIELWYKKVRKGGIISGHDYCKYKYPWDSTPFGVIEAVDEFCKKNKYKLKITTADKVYEGVEFKSWYFAKK
jgi:predicted O-methyltransferase YrrM